MLPALCPQHHMNAAGAHPTTSSTADGRAAEDAATPFDADVSARIARNKEALQAIVGRTAGGRVGAVKLHTAPRAEPARAIKQAAGPPRDPRRSERLSAPMAAAREGTAFKAQVRVRQLLTCGMPVRTGPGAGPGTGPGIGQPERKNSPH